MRYDKFKKLKTDKKNPKPCVIIQTRELGYILSIDFAQDKILVKAKRCGLVGYQEQWFNYIEIETW